MPSPTGRDRRIRRKSEYSRIYKGGVKIYGRYLILFALKADAFKVGMTVSGKVGGAVERNRAKRRIREALKLEFEGFNGTYELVFVARAGIKDASFMDIRGDIRTLLRRAK